MARIRTLLQFFAAFIVFASGTTAAQSPAMAGSKEIEFLQAAIGGDVRNVFGVSLFGGVVVFPRTFTVHITSNALVMFAAGESVDSTVRFGVVYMGRIAEVKGVRQDADTKFPLPYGSQATEKIGPLTLERYEAGQFDAYPSTLMTNGREYLWFKNNSRVLAPEVAKVFASKNGPNSDYYSANPSAAHCYGSKIQANVDYDQSGFGLSLWPAAQSAEASFASLGFKRADRFEFTRYGHQDEDGLDVLEKFFKTETPAGYRIPIDRGGKQTIVTISKETLTRELPNCIVPVKH